MSAIDAGTAAPRTAARPRSRSATRRGTSDRRIAPTAAALLVLCAILLVGVVFVQIAVIRQNMDRSDLETRAGTVAAQNRDLETQIQNAQSSPEVQAKARALGMVSAPAALAHPLTGKPFARG
jgi:cell division protein FtsB